MCAVSLAMLGQNWVCICLHKRTMVCPALVRSSIDKQTCRARQPLGSERSERSCGLDVELLQTDDLPLCTCRLHMQTSRSTRPLRSWLEPTEPRSLPYRNRWWQPSRKQVQPVMRQQPCVGACGRPRPACPPWRTSMALL